MTKATMSTIHNIPVCSVYICCYIHELAMYVSYVTTFYSYW